MIQLNHAVLEGLTKNAQQLYRDAFAHWSDLQAFGVLDSKLRADHFLAQVLHETGGLHTLIENLLYSSPQRLMEVWPKRFPDVASTDGFVRNPEALANVVYFNRIGNTRPGDGWKFIGRGLLQLTGRGNYHRVGDELGLPLEEAPTLVLHPDHAMKIAGSVWRYAGCNSFADQDSISRVTKAINGGLVGLPQRAAWLDSVRAHEVITTARSE